jgi:subtilisin family serine protease
MKRLVCFLIILNLSQAFAESEKTVKIAVIDTGIDTKSTWEGTGLAKPVLCKNGTYDFTNMINKTQTGVKVPSSKVSDDHGHGTHIAGIIAKQAKTADYCIIAMKFYDQNKPYTGQTGTINAFKKAVELKVDIINYSAGGNDRDAEECALVKKALDSGITVVAAAGNDGKNLDVIPYYPAMCDTRVIIAENIYDNGKRHPTSNFSRSGKIKTIKRVGVDVKSTVPGNSIGIMTGTSQAAAVISGDLAYKISNSRMRKGK